MSFKCLAARISPTTYMGMPVSCMACMTTARVLSSFFILPYDEISFQSIKLILSWPLGSIQRLTRQSNCKQLKHTSVEFSLAFLPAFLLQAVLIMLVGVAELISVLSCILLVSIVSLVLVIVAFIVCRPIVTVARLVLVVIVLACTTLMTLIGLWMTNSRRCLLKSIFGSSSSSLLDYALFNCSSNIIGSCFRFCFYKLNIYGWNYRCLQQLVQK